MRIVAAGESLQGFGICFLCEQYINTGDTGNIAIDTGYEFDPDNHSPLVGPKHCCGSCARSLARVLEWSSPEEVAALYSRAIEAEERLKYTLDSINSFKDIAFVGPKQIAFGN